MAVAGLWPKPRGCAGKPALFVATRLLACPWPGIMAQDHPSDGSPMLCNSLTEIEKISISTSSKQRTDGVEVTGLQPGATSHGHPRLSQTRARHCQSPPGVTHSPPPSPLGNGREGTNQPPRMSPRGLGTRILSCSSEKVGSAARWENQDKPEQCGPGCPRATEPEHQAQG